MFNFVSFLTQFLKETPRFYDKKYLQRHSVAGIVFYLLFCGSVGRIGEQAQLTSALDGLGQGSLMVSAGGGDTTGEDLASLAHELAQLSNVLVVNDGVGVSAELAHLLAGLSLEIPRRSFGSLRGSRSGCGCGSNVGIILHDGKSPFVN